MMASTSSDFSLIIDLSVEPPPVVEGTPLGGTIASDTVLLKAQSPFVVTSNVTVGAGVTLTIEPGVEVRFSQGTSLTCNGRLMAEGNAAERIVFTRRASAGSWSRISLSGPGEHRLRFCDIAYATSSGAVRADDTRLLLDHVVFSNTLEQLVDMSDTACVIQHCEFPSIQNNELLHFSDMPPNGYALIAHNRFGTPGIPATSGYNDVVDFTGGNRPGPIVRIIGNIFPQRRR